MQFLKFRLKYNFLQNTFFSESTQDVIREYLAEQKKVSPEKVRAHPIVRRLLNGLRNIKGIKNSNKAQL